MRSTIWRKMFAGLGLVIACYWAGSLVGRNSPSGGDLIALKKLGSAVPTPASRSELPLGRSSLVEGKIFAVPRHALKGMSFDRFDEDLNVTDEARVILRINDAQAVQLKRVALAFLQEYRDSQSDRIRQSVFYPKFTYEIAPVSEREALDMKHGFAAAVAEVVGEETARHLPYPIKINTGNEFQVFHVVKTSEPGAVRIAVGQTKQDGNVMYHASFHEEILLEPGEPMPERWQHLFALEGIAAGGFRDE